MAKLIVLVLVACATPARAVERLSCESPELATVVGKEIAAIKTEGDSGDPRDIIACLRDASSEDCWLRCARGHFPDARLAIDARYGHFGFFMTVTADGRFVARSDEEWKSAEVWTVKSFGVLDFDRDGVDELVEAYEPSGRGTEIHETRMLGVAGHAIRKLFSVPTLFDNTDGVLDPARRFVQKASLELVRRPDGTTDLMVKRIELHRGKKSDSDQILPKSPVTFRLHAGRFERVSPTRGASPPTAE